MQPVTARLNGSVGRFLRGRLGFDVRRPSSSAPAGDDDQLSATFTEPSGSSDAEAALIELGDDRPLELVALVEEGEPEGKADVA